MCRDQDPLLYKVREVYNVHPLKVPSDRWSPLTIAAMADRRRGRISKIGSFASVLNDSIDLPEPTTSEAAEIQGTSSAELTKSAGIETMRGLAAALGAPIDAKLEAVLSSVEVTSMSFKFQHPRFVEVDIGALGEAVLRKRVRRTPATEPFLTDRRRKNELFVITAVIVSDAFHVSVKRDASKNRSANIAIPETLTANGSLTEGHTDSYVIRGNTMLPFGFSAVALVLGSDGEIVSFDYNEDRELRAMLPGEARQVRSPHLDFGEDIRLIEEEAP